MGRWAEGAADSRRKIPGPGGQDTWPTEPPRCLRRWSSADRLQVPQAATHLPIASPHQHATGEGLDDDSGPARPLVGQAGPPHAVLLLEHDGRSGPPQLLG